MKYHLTFSVDALYDITVEADSPEDAITKGEDLIPQYVLVDDINSKEISLLDYHNVWLTDENGVEYR